MREPRDLIWNLERNWILDIGYTRALVTKDCFSWNPLKIVIYTSIKLYAFVCVCVCILIRYILEKFAQTHTHTHRNKHTHTQTNTHTYKCVCVYQLIIPRTFKQKIIRLCQINKLMHNSFILQQYVCYCSLLSTCILYGCLQRVTIPEVEIIQFVPPEDEQGTAPNMLKIVM